MATLYHPAAAPSWQNQQTQVVTVGPGDGPRWITYELELTAAQVALNNVFRFVKLGEDTVVIDGNLETDALDSHATTPLLVIDLGYSDGGVSDDPDFFVNGTVQTAVTGKNVPFATTASENTALGLRFNSTADYFVEALIQTGPATAAAGTIRVSLLVASKSATSETAVTPYTV